jgi:formylglycine-generating enzyme required for sulfatase activity
MNVPTFQTIQPGDVNYLSPLSPCLVKLYTEGRATFASGKRMYTISRPFAVMESPVTRRLWKSIMETEPWSDSDESQIRKVIGRWDDIPADCISPNEALLFAERLSKGTGLSLRLPTETEYELYASGGNYDDLYWTNECYETLSQFRSAPVYAEASKYVVFGHGPDVEIPNQRITEVKTRLPNRYGLYDTLGLVTEYVSDKVNRSKKYPSKPECLGLPSRYTNYHNDMGQYYIAKGGSYDLALEYCVRYNRCLYAGDETNDGCGLRLVTNDVILLK